MITRTQLLLLAIALIVPSLLPVNDASAARAVSARSAQRAAIKSQHILDRPNRPGHFYGNTVRRRNARRR